MYADSLILYKSKKMSTIKVLVVEDEPAIAKYIENALRGSKYTVTAIAFDYEAALYELEQDTPDVVFLDINLDGEKDGIDLAEAINARYALPFLFITSYSNTRTIERVKLTRPIGYLLKPFTEEELMSTLEIALFRYENRAKAELPSRDVLNKKLLNPLSGREYDILTGLFEGLNNQELAEANFVSINTVKTHIRGLYSKMDVTSRWELLILLRDLL